jgi:3-deoxy-manno-octulosonate cytidylyltransferase (CMP-KDO synthetase)
VLGANGKALYFSRYAIPYRRNHAAEINYYKHIGIYGYLSSVLLEITELPAGLLEQAESLEQLRWLENGYQITLGKTEIDTLSIDTPDDVKLVEKYL